MVNDALDCSFQQSETERGELDVTQLVDFWNFVAYGGFAV